MIRSLIFITAALSLTACAAEPDAETPVVAETTAAAEPIRPTLAARDYDPLLAVRGLHPQWTENPFNTSSNYTPSLGLDRTEHSWRNTSLNYDRTDEGGVYMIQVRSGLPGRCDSGPDLALAFNQFAEDFSLGAPVEEIRPKLIEAWASKDGWAEGEIGKVMVRAIGGCPRALVVKAL